jgi:threonine/homoserine/homoserine lactone efflux protein
MIDGATLTAYALVVLGLFLIPGPAVLLTIARSAAGGRRVGVATGLGIATGDLIHTLMAALGLSAILMTSALAFAVVKYAGVAYLIYLGLRAFFERPQDLDLPESRGIDPDIAFRQAIVAEVLNPKTALFFLAFLPQFVHPETGPAIAQLAVLGAVFVLMSAVYTTLIALGAAPLGRWLRGHRGIGRVQGKVVGIVYVGLGLRLAMQER